MMWSRRSPALILVAALALAAVPARRALAQSGSTIRGAVLDSSSQRGVPGAQVLIVGTSRGTTTDDAGGYALRGVPAGTVTVRVHRIGYEQSSRTVSVNGRDESVVNFTLRPAPTVLTTVVSVGYGTASRQNVSSAIASVDSSAIANVAVAGIDAAIQGKIPGVQVMQNSGEPGSGLSIRVRGPASLNAGNQPLYVVDGVPIIQGTYGQISLSGQDMTALTGLSPDEIATIDVLKDAAAAAIYGSRGSNGVILITTKRGQPGRMRFTLSGYGGTQKVERTIGLLDAKQYVELMNESAKNDGYAPSDYDFTPGVDDANTYDWQGAVFRRASVNNANLSMSGGSDRLKYYVSGGRFDQRGIVIGSGYRREAGRINLDLGATDKLFFTASVGLTRESNDRIPGDQSLDGVVTNAIGLQPMRPIYGSSFGYGGRTEGLRYSNPVAIGELNFDSFKTQRALGNFDAKLLLNSRAYLTGRVGMDLYGVDELTWGSPKIDRTYAASANGVGRTAHSTNTKYVAESFLSVDVLNADANKLTITGGSGVEYNHSVNEYIRGEGFPTGFTTFVKNAATITNWDGSATDNNLVSFFARANWSIRDRYLLSASLRTDGSSRFGSANRYGTFPAISAGWVVSDEPMMSGLARLATLKLRGSFGVTGNQGIGDFASMSLANGASYSGAPGVAVQQLGNPDLRWETTHELDLGADVGLLDGRVSVITDWYDRRTSDLLVRRPVPATSGFTTIWDNIGSIRNRGVDLGIHTINVDAGTGSGFGWTSDLNVTWNRNKVTSLYQGQLATYNVSSRVTSAVAEGQPIGEFYLYRFSRVDPATGNALFFKANGTETTSPTTSDLAFVGSPQPNYYGGFTNALTFGPLDLRGFVQFSQGGKVFNMMRIFTDDGGYSYDNKTTHVLARWQKPGDVTDQPRMSYDGTSGARLPSSRMVEDGSFVRLGEVSLGYKLPPLVTAKLGMDNGRIYVSGRNLHTWTNYTGYNPDVNSAGVLANVVMGVDYYAYPLARTFTLGVTAGW
jgi:TonB-linked SusC/RagA family outer membrane protein